MALSTQFDYSKYLRTSLEKRKNNLCTVPYCLFACFGVIFVDATALGRYVRLVVKESKVSHGRSVYSYRAIKSNTWIFFERPVLARDFDSFKF